MKTSDKVKKNLWTWLTLLCLLVALVVALYVRFSYQDLSGDYASYTITGGCNSTEFDDLLKENHLSSFADLYDQADLVVLGEDEGQHDIFQENMAYTVKVQEVYKGAAQPGDSLRIMEFAAFIPQLKSLTTTHGSVPPFAGERYLLFLKPQQQYTEQAERTWYLVTQSPLGRYQLDSEIQKPEGQALSSLKKVGFLAEDAGAEEKYKSFYESAVQFCQEGGVN